MRGAAAVVVMLVAMLNTAGSAGAAERTWRVQAGAGYLPQTRDAPFAWCAGGTLGVAGEALPWMQLGAEAGLYEYSGTPEDNYGYYLRIDRSYLVTLAATFRVQVPVTSGAAPFLLMQSGGGRLDHGAVVYSYDIFRFRWYEHAPEYVWLHSAGVGLRVVVPGAWPDPEASIRHVIWAARPAISLTEARLVLSF